MKRNYVFLVAGLIFFVAGMVMPVFHGTPKALSVILMTLGGASFGAFFGIQVGTNRDEMVQRADIVSGCYTAICTFYFVMVCLILNIFSHLLFDTIWFMVIVMIFMSLSYLGIRFYLLRRGVSE